MNLRVFCDQYDLTNNIHYSPTKYCQVYLPKAKSLWLHIYINYHDPRYDTTDPATTISPSSQGYGNMSS